MVVFKKGRAPCSPTKPSSENRPNDASDWQITSKTPKSPVSFGSSRKPSSTRPPSWTLKGATSNARRERRSLTRVQRSQSRETIGDVIGAAILVARLAALLQLKLAGGAATRCLQARLSGKYS